MCAIHIEKVEPDNLFLLQAIGKQTFSETFASFNSEEDMRRYLEKSFNDEQLKKELTEPFSEFYFAQHHNTVIGYLKVNFGGAQTETRDASAMEIERIYVLKAYHGQNVGQLLFEKASQLARSNRCDYIWLGVWENNFRAISFYKKLGFEEFDRHIFQLGNDAQTDIMMRLVLT